MYYLYNKKSLYWLYTIIFHLAFYHKLHFIRNLFRRTINNLFENISFATVIFELKNIIRISNDNAIHSTTNDLNV
jgi:hypothetical protein